jgi:hypothetical protein
MDSALTVATTTILTASAADDGIGVQGYELLIDGASVAQAAPDSLVNGRVEFVDVPVEAGPHTVKIRANLQPYLDTEERTVNVGS